MPDACSYFLADHCLTLVWGVILIERLNMLIIAGARKLVHYV